MSQIQNVPSSKRDSNLEVQGSSPGRNIPKTELCLNILANLELLSKFLARRESNSEGADRANHSNHHTSYIMANQLYHWHPVNKSSHQSLLLLWFHFTLPSSVFFAKNKLGGGFVWKKWAAPKNRNQDSGGRCRRSSRSPASACHRSRGEGESGHWIEVVVWAAVEVLTAWLWQ